MSDSNSYGDGDNHLTDRQALEACLTREILEAHQTRDFRDILTRQALADLAEEEGRTDDATNLRAMARMMGKLRDLLAGLDREKH